RQSTSARRRRRAHRGRSPGRPPRKARRPKRSRSRHPRPRGRAPCRKYCSDYTSASEKTRRKPLGGRGGASGQTATRSGAALVMLGQLVAIEIEHKQTNRRRQVAVLSLGIDRGDEVRQGHIAPAGDLLEPPPERILEADAGLVASDDDGALDDRRFHRSSPVSIRWRSRSRRALASRLGSSSRSALLRPCRSRLADAARSASCRSACLRALRKLTIWPILHSISRSWVMQVPRMWLRGQIRPYRGGGCAREFPPAKAAK